jgi:hypothetical protein
MTEAEHERLLFDRLPGSFLMALGPRIDVRVGLRQPVDEIVGEPIGVEVGRHAEEHPEHSGPVTCFHDVDGEHQAVGCPPYHVLFE